MPASRKTTSRNTQIDMISIRIIIINRGFEQQPQVDVSALTDYDQMKDKLIMEVVSAETNAEMLANVPHKDMEDMAVVYRFVLESNDDGRATILVTNQLIETMGVTPEQLHADAMENAPQIKPVEIKGMSEVMAEMMGVEQAEMMGLYPVAPEDEKIFVATVRDKVHGAGVLAYQVSWIRLLKEQAETSISYLRVPTRSSSFPITERWGLRILRRW